MYGDFKMKSELRRLILLSIIAIGVIAVWIFISIFVKMFAEHNEASCFPTPGTPAYEQYTKMIKKIKWI